MTTIRKVIGEYLLELYNAGNEDLDGFCLSNAFIQDASCVPPSMDERFDARKVVGIGYEAVSLLLSDGTVLKLGQHPHQTTRAFDVPVLCGGMVDEIPYSIQPYVKMTASWDDLWRFERRIQRLGYKFEDPHISQIGYYKGRLVLVDPDAVISRSANDSGSTSSTAQY